MVDVPTNSSTILSPSPFGVAMSSSSSISSSVPESMASGDGAVAGYILNGLGIVASTSSSPSSPVSQSSILSSTINDSQTHISQSSVSSITTSHSLSSSTFQSFASKSLVSDATLPSLPPSIKSIASSVHRPIITSIALTANASLSAISLRSNLSSTITAAQSNLSSPSTTIVHNITVVGPSYAGANGSDCDALLSIYEASSRQWNISLPISSVTTYTNGLGVSTQTFTQYSVSTSVYISGGQSYGNVVTYSTSTWYRTDDWGETITSSITQDWVYPFPPPCTMPDLDAQSCSELQADWYTKFNPPASHAPFPKDKSIGPGCTMGCVQCVIRGNHVDVLYWPVSTAPGQPNVTITPTGGGIAIAEFRGHKLTSPTVYLAYDTLTATNNCGQVGSTYADGVLAIPLTETLSSHGWRARYRTQMPTLSFNFADLNEPMPLSIYQQQPSCWPNVTQRCPVVIPGNYNPSVNLPSAVRTLDPAWKDCADDWLGVFDPPKALQSVDALTEDSSPTSTPTEAAQVGSVPTLTQPTATDTKNRPGAPAETKSSNAVASNIGAAIGATPASQEPSLHPVASNIGIALGDTPISSNNAGFGQAIDSPGVFVAMSSTLAVAQTIATIGTQPVIAAPGVSNAVVVGGTTLSAGGPAVTIAQSVISVGTNGLVASPLAAAQPAVTIPIPSEAFISKPLVASLADNPDVAVPGPTNAVAIAGGTLTLGGPAVRLSGVVASFGINGLVVSSQGQTPVTIAVLTGSQTQILSQVTSIAGIPVLLILGLSMSGSTTDMRSSSTTSGRTSFRLDPLSSSPRASVSSTIALNSSSRTSSSSSSLEVLWIPAIVAVLLLQLIHV